MGESTVDLLPQGNRLQILTPEEYELLWGLPLFTASEREIFFSLTPREQGAFSRLRTPRTHLHFLLLLGYFKARQRFFTVDLAAMGDDIEYLCHRYLQGVRAVDLAVSKHTRMLHISWILDLFGYRQIEQADRLDLERRASRAVRISSRPVYVLRNLVDWLHQRRIVLPGYTYLKDVVRWALLFERNRLSETLSASMTRKDKRLLDRLLRGESGLHTVTTIKHQPRNFSHQQLLTEIKRGEQLHGLYAVAERIVTHTELSMESVRFYASLVDYYTVYKLKRMNRALCRLYLLCLVKDRYQRLNEHLISAFCALVRRYNDEVNDKAKETYYIQRQQVNQDIDEGAKVLYLFLDPDIPDDRPFGEVRAQAQAMLSTNRIARLCEHLSHDHDFDKGYFEWQAVDNIITKVKRNLRPLIRFLTWSGTPAHRRLLEAILALSEAFNAGKQLPSQAVDPSLIPERPRRHLFIAGSLQKDRYEYLLYRQLRDRIESGDIFCAESARYRSFEDDLIDDETWAQKGQLLPQFVATTAPINIQLETLKQTLNARFKEVNACIQRGENQFVQWRNGHAVWRRGHSAEPTGDYEPLFDTAERIDIDQLMIFVDQKTKFLSAFEHVMGRYQRDRATPPITIAALMAYATNIGVGRMAEISNITRTRLANTAANFIRLETLNEASDRLANATARLPIFRHYDIGGSMHSSSDGQRFESSIPTINARHSAKYFGLKKGVVAYTLLANHVPLSARIIGANEHESHYVFDVLFNNLTDIQPDTHSTDTHGVNQVNFVLLHLFGYRFAPRYHDFKSKIKTDLYSFKHPNAYTGCALRPVRRIRESLIQSEWENIERILLSLALKSTSQSVIVSKLSSHRRQNRTKQALWEFEHIIRSLYLLDYLDSPLLRRNVHRALNRGETYHRLRRAIAYAHGGRFRVRSQHEQQLWNECATYCQCRCLLQQRSTFGSA